MPVSFEQPQPFSQPIATGFGETQQFNQTLPTLAGMYEAQARRSAAAGQAYADNAQRASAASAENQTRAQLAQNEMGAHDVMQARQFQQERALQAERIQSHERSQMFDWAVHSDQVGQQEMMRMQRQQAGLAQLQQDVEEGYITKEDAADAAYQLRTGVDRVRQRVESQHAAELKQQAAFRAQMMAAETQNMENAKAFQVEAGLKGHTIRPFTDPNTGKQHWLAVDDKGKFYNPLMEHATKPDAEDKNAGGERAHLGTNGRYDQKKGLADAKAFAEAELGPRPKEPPKGEPDVGKDSRAAWDDLVKRRMEGTMREFSQAKGGQPNTPGQQAQADADQRGDPASSPAAQSTLSKIQANKKIGTVERDVAERSVGLLAQLLAKPADRLTPEDFNTIRQLKQTIESAVSR